MQFSLSIQTLRSFQLLGRTSCSTALRLWWDLCQIDITPTVKGFILIMLLLFSLLRLFSRTLKIHCLFAGGTKAEQIDFLFRALGPIWLWKSCLPRPLNFHCQEDLEAGMMESGADERVSTLKRSGQRILVCRWGFSLMISVMSQHLWNGDWRLFGKTRMSVAVEGRKWEHFSFTLIFTVSSWVSLEMHFFIFYLRDWNSCS